MKGAAAAAAVAGAHRKAEDRTADATTECVATFVWRLKWLFLPFIGESPSIVRFFFFFVFFWLYFVCKWTVYGKNRVRRIESNAAPAYFVLELIASLEFRLVFFQRAFDTNYSLSFSLILLTIF